MEKRISCTCQKLNPSYPVHSLVTIVTELSQTQYLVSNAYNTDFSFLSFFFFFFFVSGRVAGLYSASVMYVLSYFL
jgi:hypothetical protein